MSNHTAIITPSKKVLLPSSYSHFLKNLKNTVFVAGFFE